VRTERDVSLVTPEAVVVSFDSAGLGTRMLAFALDALFGLAVVLAAFFVFGATGAGGDVGTTLLVLGIFAFRLLYPAIAESRRGRTLGKAALGIRVVTVEGAPVRFRHAIVRSAIGIFEMDATGFTVALVAVLVSRRSQRLGDRVAGTVVVRERTAVRPPAPVAFTPWPGTEAYVASLDTTSVDAEQYAALRSFLIRAPSLAPAARDRVAQQLAEPLAISIGHVRPANITAELFLLSLAVAVQQRSAARVGEVMTPAETGERPPAAPGPGAEAAVVEPPRPEGGFAPPT
jgi:uncharacterized RDD family membrane protein YckC